MADFYSEMQGIAAGVLREFKQGTIHYIELTPGAGPADNPGAASEAPTLIDGVARGVSAKYVDNTVIVGTDLQVTMPAGVVSPTMKGFVRIDGVRHKIVKIMNIPAAGTPVTHILIVRR